MKGFNLKQQGGIYPALIERVAKGDKTGIRLKLKAFYGVIILLVVAFVLFGGSQLLGKSIAVAGIIAYVTIEYLYGVDCVERHLILRHARAIAAKACAKSADANEHLYGDSKIFERVAQQGKPYSMLDDEEKYVVDRAIAKGTVNPKNVFLNRVVLKTIECETDECIQEILRSSDMPMRISKQKR